MYTIENTTLINSTPARILEALTTKDGIKGWWTTDVDCNAEKREATFRFEKPAGVTAMTFHLDSRERSHDRRRVLAIESFDVHAGIVR